MTYYQILKKRRLDLNLSIQDIAIQTHLSPDFIRAIEENNLDVFSDDFSFVRYFVHSYADVIGVNWMAIAPEVDASISAYAAARDMALTQAQRRMIESMPSSEQSKRKKKKRRRRKPVFDALASRISRNMNWDPKNRLSRTVIIAGVCVLAVLGLVSMGVDALSERNIENAKLAKQQELKEKEQETQRLADQLKSQKGTGSSSNQQDASQSGLTIAPSGDGVNSFIVQGAVSQNAPVELELNMAQDASVSVYLNGTASESHDFQGAWNYSFQSSADAVAELEISGYQNGDTLSINGTAVPLDSAGFTDGYGVITLTFAAADSSADQNAQESSEDEDPQTVPDGSEEDGSYEEGYDEYSGYDDSVYDESEQDIYSDNDSGE